MFRSPPQLRSGSKGQPVPLSTDKPKPVRSLSDSSSSAYLDSDIAMPDKKESIVDPAVIAVCVDKHLAGTDVTDRLVSRLTAELRSVVEEAVKAALTAVHEEIGLLRGEVETLKIAVKELDERLADRTDELEQYQRRNNLRIFGVKETAREDTDEIVAKMCQEKLGVNLPPEAICRSHRIGMPPKLGPNGETRHRPIIVRFTSYRYRREVHSAKKKLKGSGTTIREDLTMRRLDVLRSAAALHGIRNTWTQDGRILWVDESGQKGMATRLGDVSPSK